MKKLLTTLLSAILFWSCNSTSRLTEPNESIEQLNRTDSRSQASVVGEVFTATW